MGWLEARTRYSDGSSLVSQNVEDLVARRVLRGLNVPVAKLAMVERYRFGETWHDDALWVRTARLLFCLSAEQAFPFDKHNIRVTETSTEHKPILKLFESDPSAIGLTLTRVKGTTISWAYFTVPDLNIANSRLELSPPFHVLAGDEPYLLFQETEAFIRPFGPFHYEEVNN